MGSAIAIRDLPDWPAALTREEALAYTRVGEAQMREWESRGAVRFRPRGPRGAAIVLRADLEAALRSLFGRGVADNDGPIEF